MTIQWYPGHMHKAQKEIKEALPKVDLVIEVVDARIPYSSTNPDVAKILENSEKKRPIIRILNKVDLADPAITKLWCEEFDSHQDTRSLPITAKKPEEVRKLIKLCHQLLPEFKKKEKPINAMIMGIPNVGKSTIINILSNRTIAKVGNEPAVTKRQQRIDLDEGIILWDTPGFLWPKIENTNSSYRLAISGAIKDTVLEYDDIAYYAMDYLKVHYLAALKSTYKLDGLFVDDLPQDTTQILEEIGRLRGCLQRGGRIDLDRVCKILVHEFRSSILGNISLETPEMVKHELVEVEEKIRLKAEKDEANKGKKKKRKRR